MDKRNFRKTGTISKVNKKTGEVTIIFAGRRPEFELHSDVIFLEIDGSLVPFFVEQEGSVSPEYFRVTLEDYNDPEVALRFVGCKVFLPLEENDQLTGVESVDMETIVGFEITDKKLGRLGEVADVIESPEQVLLQVFHDDTEILIPFTEAFLLGLDIEKKSILLDLPDGLVDLYLDK